MNRANQTAANARTGTSVATKVEIEFEEPWDEPIFLSVARSWQLTCDVCQYMSVCAMARDAQLSSIDYEVHPYLCIRIALPVYCWQRT